MKTISTEKLKKALRKIGLYPARTGQASGHSTWKDSKGRICHPVLRHHDVPWAYLFSLSRELETKQICTRELFFNYVKCTT